MTHRRHHAFTITELLTVLIVVGLAVSLLIPVLGQTRKSAFVLDSLNILYKTGIVHAHYAADNNGRQLSFIVDDFSSYGSSGPAAVVNYAAQNGEAHPPLLLGYGPSTSNPDFIGLWGYFFPPNPVSYAGNWAVIVPFDFNTKWGAFRYINAKAFHDYNDGRFYGDFGYPPNDAVPFAIVEPYFASEHEFVFIQPEGLYATSYVLSPAAMFHPDVLRSEAAGGFRDPFSFDTSFASPSLAQAVYPHLKTHVLEHHWNQNAPADLCNPALAPGSYDGCEPYYFNHALASEPATLFFDGHVRLLPNSEVIAADQQVLDGTSGVDGLWHRGTPLGSNGYFGDVSYDGTIVSHHVLTTDGILGRDTLTP